MGFTREDKELRKFEEDPSDSSKFIVKTKVENQTSDPIPVSIQNTDTSVDLEVNIAENVTIDSSTPVNVSIDGTPNVNVANSPTVGVSGTVATNATIQNSYLNVYSYGYTGSAWNFMSVDSSGRSIGLSKTYYSAADITALGSSTDIREWMAAYNDGQLEKKYVSEYDDEHEQLTYYQSPSLANGTKCLKLIRSYSTENSVKVIKSIFAGVDDWSYDDEIQGSLTLTNTTVINPDPNSSIATGTDVTTLSIASTTPGTITLTLSGTNASLYRLSDGTSTGSSLTYDASKTYVVETASDFSGATYSHAITVTATSSLFSLTSSVNLTVAGTFTGAAFTNDKYFARTDSSSISDASYLDLTGTDTVNTDEKWSISFWFKSHTDASGSTVTDGTYYNDIIFLTADSGSYDWFYGWVCRVRSNTMFLARTFNGSNLMTVELSTSIHTLIWDQNWHNVIITHDGTGTQTTTHELLKSNTTFYVDGSAQTLGSSGLGGTYGNVNSVGGTGLNLGKRGYGVSANQTLTVTSNAFDEVGYWNDHVVTSTEAALIYNSGTPADLANTTGLTSPTKFFRAEDSDIGYDSISETDLNADHELQTKDY